MGTGIFSDDLDTRLNSLATDAITTAAVTGSLGATSQIEGKNGVDAIRVERIALHPAGWRIAHVTVAGEPDHDHPLVDTVLIREGNPGQYHSHAA